MWFELRVIWRQWIAGWYLVAGVGRALRGKHRPPDTNQ